MLESQRRRGVQPRTAIHVGVVAVVWTGVVLAVILSLLSAGFAGSQVLAYVAAWLLGSTFPGVMLWRALGGHTTIVRELGFGSVLGIALQLLAWALATSVHHPRLMVLLPIGVAVVFAVTPGLRKHWWPRRSARLSAPLHWHVGMAVVIVYSIYRFHAFSMVRRGLPPDPIVVSRDLWYNSAISSELSRTIRPQDPFVAGEALKYHWFADAHVTATAQLSGLSIVDVMMNAWQVLILVVLLLAVAAAAEHFMDGPPRRSRDGALLSDVRRWWVGPVAAFFTFASTAVWRFGNPGVERVGNGFIPTSPSGILGLVVILGLVGPTLDLLRRRSRAGTWVSLILLLALASGTKPSLLPVVAFGALVVLLVDLVLTRRLNRAMTYLFVMAVAVASVSAPVLAGSTGGSRIQLFALLVTDSSYQLLYGGKEVLPAAGGWLLPALADGVPHAVPIVSMLLAIWLLAETPRLLSLFGLLSRSLRTDPAVLWACAVGAGGYAAMWVVAHPGHSQHFFWTETNALMTVLTLTNAVRLIPVARRVKNLLLPLLLIGAPGAVAAYLTTRIPEVDLRGAISDVIAGRLHPYFLMAGGSAVSLILALLLRFLVRRLSLPILTTVVAYSLAAAIPVPLTQLQAVRPYKLDPLPVVGVGYQYVSPEQQTAALWLGSHSSPNSVVATNMFCWPMGKDSPSCAVNTMWLSGLSGRRTLLSDWGYSVKSTTRYNGTVPMNALPNPWPERRSLSTQAVEASTSEVLERLRRDYGARWIFADDRATKISPELKRLATLRYRSEHIEIYQLRDSYPELPG